MSWPLVYEIPIYLRYMRFFRLFSVMAAWVYSAVYGYVVLDWLYQIYFEPVTAVESFQLFDILQNMFLAYNIIFHLHIIPVNVVIFLKEFMLMVFPPLLIQDQGQNLDLQDVTDVVRPSTYTGIAKGQMPDTEERIYHKTYKR